MSTLYYVQEILGDRVIMEASSDSIEEALTLAENWFQSYIRQGDTVRVICDGELVCTYEAKP